MGEAFLRWSVTSRGFYFSVCREGKNIRFEEWNFFSKELSKNDYVAIQILNQLLDEEDAGSIQIEVFDFLIKFH